jgi:hypothetical protein
MDSTAAQITQSPRPETPDHAGKRISFIAHPGGLEAASLLTMTPAHP